MSEQDAQKRAREYQEYVDELDAGETAIDRAITKSNLKHAGWRMFGSYKSGHGALLPDPPVYRQSSPEARLQADQWEKGAIEDHERVMVASDDFLRTVAANPSDGAANEYSRRMSQMRARNTLDKDIPNFAESDAAVVPDAFGPATPMVGLKIVRGD